MRLRVRLSPALLPALFFGLPACSGANGVDLSTRAVPMDATVLDEASLSASDAASPGHDAATAGDDGSVAPDSSEGDDTGLSGDAGAGEAGGDDGGPSLCTRICGGCCDAQGKCRTGNATALCGAQRAPRAKIARRTRCPLDRVRLLRLEGLRLRGVARVQLTVLARAPTGVVIGALLGLAGCADVWGMKDLSQGDGGPDATADGNAAEGGDDGESDGSGDEGIVESGGEAGDAIALDGESEAGPGDAAMGDGGNDAAIAMCQTICPTTGCCDAQGLCHTSTMLGPTVCGSGGNLCQDCKATMSCSVLVPNACCITSTGKCGCETALLPTCG